MKRISIIVLVLVISTSMISCTDSNATIKNTSDIEIDKKVESVAETKNDVDKRLEEVLSQETNNQKIVTPDVITPDVITPDVITPKQKDIVVDNIFKEKEFNVKKINGSDARSIADKAMNAIQDIINVSNLKYDKNVVNSDKSYGISDKYKSEEIIREKLKDYCTKTAINKFIIENTIIQNDKFYIVFDNSRTILPIINSSIVILDQKNNILDIVVINKDADKIVLERNYNFIYEHEQWLLTEIK